MKLIICEKKSLALNVANAIGNFKKKDGCFITNEYIITFAFGHLFQLKDVQDYQGKKVNWKDIKLPFIPEEFQFKLRDDSGVKKQFKIIKELLKDNSITEIIHCGDADREGQIIIDTLISNLKTNIKVNRLWLPEQTHETIRKELKNMKSNEDYLNLAQEGYARTYLDWLLGINLTIHLTTKKGTRLKVGRVMIPVVKYIYDRDMEIRNFKPEKYLQLLSNTEGIKLEIRDKFKLEDLEAIEEKKKLFNSSEAIVTDIKKENIKKHPKKLFSLSKLQSELSKSHKINFQTSLKVIQSLYERGYITYPRTNTEYLATNEIPKIESIIKNYPNINLKVENVKSIFDNSKVESHSALTITNKTPRIDEFEGIEKTIYETIFNRFLSNFLNEDTIVSKTSLEIQVANETFVLKGEVIEQEGFFKYEPQNITDNLPKLNKGDRFKVNFKEIEKVTTPPKKINESSLAAYLKNPFKTEKTTEEEEYKAILEGVEIGTEATRTGIISKCVDEGYISQKAQSYSIEIAGEELIKTLDTLEVNLYKERTVEFSKSLKRIYKSDLTLNALISIVSEELETIISKDIKIDKTPYKAPEKEIIGICPKCGKNIYQGKTKTNKINYYCENYKDGCKFTVWETSKFYSEEIKITKSKAKQLLKKDGKASFKLKSKTGKEYEAYLKIKLSGNYINFENVGFVEKS